MERIIASNGVEAWESRLAEAARRFVGCLTATDATPTAGVLELRATLLRLGFSTSEIEAASADAAGLCPALSGRMQAALRRELDGLARRARAGRFDYDLNRHIVVYRADRRLHALLGEPPQPAGSPLASRAPRAARSSSTAAPARASMRR